MRLHSSAQKIVTATEKARRDGAVFHKLNKKKKKKKKEKRTNFYPKKHEDNTRSGFDDRIEERRLDGSRDYWPYRDFNGTLGSHSKYDDMGDESKP